MQLKRFGFCRPYCFLHCDTLLSHFAQRGRPVKEVVIERKILVTVLKKLERAAISD